MKKELKIFDNPKNIRKLIQFFFIVLGILLIAEFFIHKHPYFVWEESPWFFAAFGFVSCVLVIFTAKLLRFLTRRDENYYD